MLREFIIRTGVRSMIPRVTNYFSNHSFPFSPPSLSLFASFRLPKTMKSMKDLLPPLALSPRTAGHLSTPIQMSVRMFSSKNRRIPPSASLPRIPPGGSRPPPPTSSVSSPRPHRPRTFGATSVPVTTVASTSLLIRSPVASSPKVPPGRRLASSSASCP